MLLGRGVEVSPEDLPVCAESLDLPNCEESELGEGLRREVEEDK